MPKDTRKLKRKPKAVPKYTEAQKLAIINSRRGPVEEPSKRTPVTRSSFKDGGSIKKKIKDKVKSVKNKVLNKVTKTTPSQRASNTVKRRIKKGKPTTSASSKAIMDKVVNRTQDPVRSGSAGSGSVNKTPPSMFEKAKSALGYSKGGFIQHD